jgi:hypothetical protein
LSATDADGVRKSIDFWHYWKLSRVRMENMYGRYDKGFVSAINRGEMRTVLTCEPLQQNQAY